MKLSENLRRYIDAGFPILYVSSFEEDVIDNEIKEAANNSGTIEKISTCAVRFFKIKEILGAQI